MLIKLIVEANEIIFFYKFSTLDLCRTIDNFNCYVNSKSILISAQPLLQPSSDSQIFSLKMIDLEVREGDDATFDVRVDAHGCEVDWYREEELLEDEGRIIIEDPHPDGDDNLYSLTIENCGPKDSGNTIFHSIMFYKYVHICYQNSCAFM